MFGNTECAKRTQRLRSRARRRWRTHQNGSPWMARCKSRKTKPMTAYPRHKLCIHSALTAFNFLQKSRVRCGLARVGMAIFLPNLDLTEAPAGPSRFSPVASQNSELGEPCCEDPAMLRARKPEAVTKRLKLFM